MGTKLYIALDGGGTSTRGGLYDDAGHLRHEAEGGPSNPVAHGFDPAVSALEHVARELLDAAYAPIHTLAAAVSGARGPELRERLARRLADDLAVPRVVVTDDLRPILYANAGVEPAALVIAGTGSSVLVQAGPEESVLFGGWGGVMGDDGSAYALAVEALRAAAHAIDGVEDPTALVDELPKAAGVPDFESLPAWAEAASKDRVAELARVVLRLAEQGDPLAARCVSDGAKRLVALLAAGRERLDLPPDAPVILHGGLLLGSLFYRVEFERLVAERFEEAPVRAPSLRGHRAVFQAARAETLPGTVPAAVAAPRPGNALPPTERRSETGPPLDALSAEGIVRAMNAADATVPAAVERALPALAEAVEVAAAALRAGGRIVYLGAGTSGRLGLLDASECPPTFGVAPGRVVAFLAGGEAALSNSVEGSEDDTAQAAADLATLDPPLGRKDLVVGIAASGSTPYVRAGLDAAARAGARTVLLCCNPAIRDGADLVVVLDTGPEVLPGSTRLKAGTATKLALNMISTGAMVLAGRVYGGYMVGMNPINAKLRRRAARIVSALTEAGDAEAERLLAEAGYRIPVAVLMARLSLSAEEAEKRWREAGEDLRAALEGKQGESR